MFGIVRKSAKLLRKYSSLKLEEIPLSTYFPASPNVDSSDSLVESISSKMQTTKLGNGVRVSSSEYNQRGNTVITVQVDAGSRYESYKNQGVSHFTQRFFFDHTNTRTKLRFVTEMEKTGATVSSSHSREHITYKIEAMREVVPKLFELLSDSILGNRLHECDLDAKKELVQEDIEQYSNAPEVVLNEALHRIAYAEKGLGKSVLCPPHNLEAIHIDTIVEHFERHYRPERIKVVGTNINHDDLVQIADHYLKFPEKSEQVEKVKGAYVGGELRLHETVAFGPKTFSVVAWKGTCQNDADELFAFNVLSNVLGEVDLSAVDPSTKGKSGLLYKSTQDDSGLSSIKSFSINYSDAGLFGVLVSGKSDSVGKALAASVKVLRDIASSEISDEDLTRAKNQALLKFYSGLESNTGSNEFFSKFEDIETIVKGIKGVTKVDVTRVCAQALKTNPTLVSYGDLSAVPPKGELFQ